MVRLEAKYEIDLENGKLLINRPITCDLSFTINIDDFDVVHHNTSFKFYNLSIIWHGNEEGVCS
jgi:hypothetical protein